MNNIKIETYWNVNIFVNLTNTCQCPIKIETYWNVNCSADDKNSHGRN